MSNYDANIIDPNQPFRFTPLHLAPVSFGPPLKTGGPPPCGSGETHTKFLTHEKGSHQGPFFLSISLLPTALLATV